MQVLQLKNQKIMEILSFIDDIIGNEKFNTLLDHRSQLRTTNQPWHPTSEGYLRNALKDPFGYQYPTDALGTDLERLIDYDDVAKQKNLRNLIRELGVFLGAPRLALTVFYPDNGYIGWHHNGNANGYNILFSYSKNGDGCFYHYDYDLDKIISIHDQPGWNVKAGYYPKLKNKEDKVYWHSAGNKTQRVTIAFIIDHKLLWQDMIDEIENEY